MHLGKNKILITGATGFLGYEIFKSLSKNYNVVPTSRTKKKNFIYLDYSQKKIKNQILKDVDTIIHLASLDRDEVKKNYQKAKEINFDFTKELIELSILNGVKNFIYVSSINVYGENFSNNVKENIKPKPKDRYSRLKLMCEKLLKQKSNKQKIVILRLSNIFGVPHIITKGYHKLFIPSICLSALKNKKIFLNTNGDQYRDFLELNLFIKILNKLLKRINKMNNFTIFNISSYNSLKIIEIAKKVVFIFKNKFNQKVKIIKGKKIYEKKYSINNNKIKNFLNLKINNNYNKTLFNMINFLKK